MLTTAPLVQRSLRGKGSLTGSTQRTTAQAVRRPPRRPMDAHYSRAEALTMAPAKRGPMHTVLSLVRACLCCSRCFGEVLVVNRRRLRVLKQVGEGGFAFVYVVEDTATGQVFAAKRMLLSNEEQAQRARREVEVQRVRWP